MRHSTIRAKACFSNKAALAMVFKLADAAQKSWRRLDGYQPLPMLVLVVKFTDELEFAATPVVLYAQTAAA